MGDFLLAFCDNPDNNVTIGAENIQRWFDSFDYAQGRFAHHPELVEGLIWWPPSALYETV
jgi:hypothetical protein